MKRYTLKQAGITPDLNDAWSQGEWKNANIADISIFRKKGSDHRPETNLKMLYNSEGIYGYFKVYDRYILSVGTGNHAPVCQDSCVELFIQPKSDKGYFNFEFNCGGAILANYITDPTRTEDGFKEMVELKNSELDLIKTAHSMPDIVDPEIREPKEWCLKFFIPFSIMQNYLGPLSISKKSQWRANFYKCGDKTSHPHWASWNPLTATNFHLPECFGIVQIGE